MNCAIYSQRRIFKKQDDMSIADQEAICKVKAEFEGFTLVGTFRDDGVHGYTRFHDRSGGDALLSAVSDNEIDVLVIESLGRIEGGSEFQIATARYLEGRGVRIIGVADCYDSQKLWCSVLFDMRVIILEKHLIDVMKRTHCVEYCPKIGVKQRTVNWFKHITFIVTQLIKVRRKKPRVYGLTPDSIDRYIGRDLN